MAIIFNKIGAFYLDEVIMEWHRFLHVRLLR